AGAVGLVEHEVGHAGRREEQHEQSGDQADGERTAGPPPVTATPVIPVARVRLAGPSQGGRVRLGGRGEAGAGGRGARGGGPAGGGGGGEGGGGWGGGGGSRPAVAAGSRRPRPGSPCLPVGDRHLRPGARRPRPDSRVSRMGAAPGRRHLHPRRSRESSAW